MNSLMKVMMKRNPDLGLLVLRVGLGLIFVLAGWSKLSEMEPVVAMFAGLGLPAFVAWLVALVEFVGGLLLIVGLYVEIVGWLLAIVMLVAILLVKSDLGFNAARLDIALLAMSLAVAMLGAGSHSLKARMKK